MIVDHLPHVHAIDVIGAENRDQFWAVPFEQIKVLINRVRRALIPIIAGAHLRRHRNDEMFAEKIRGAPTAVDVFQERLRLELSHHVNRQNPRVDEIRQHEVDNPISAAERHRRFSAMLR